MEREPGSPLANWEAALHLAMVVVSVAKVSAVAHATVVLEVVAEFQGLALELVARMETVVMQALSLHRSELFAVV
jgi:hypothetical protein